MSVHDHTHAADDAALAALDRVTVRYGSTVAAADVTLEVRCGQVYALLGRNGAGKSSLVRCLLGQQRPTEGRALLFGADAWTTRRRAMARVGVVPEDPDLPRNLHADDLAAFAARLYPRWDSVGVAARLDRLGVPRRLPSGRLSKGQRTQLALTLALAHSPELLILDDPTLGLDAVARRELWDDLIVDLADRGTTVLLTTHDLAGADGIAGRVGILKGGRLVLDEDLEALRARFRRVSFRRRPASVGEAGSSRLEALGALAVAGSSLGFEAVVSSFSDDTFARFSASPEVVDPQARAMSLEEIFVAVAGDGPGGA